MSLTLLDKKINSEVDSQMAQRLLRKRVLATPCQSEMYIEVNGCKYLNFSSNDYLGLSNAPKLIEDALEAVSKYGLGSSSSPLITGYTTAHRDLEDYLCQQTGHEAAMLFSSGFSANHGLMTALFDKSDVVIADKLVHASLIDGLKHSGARLKRFRHNDVNHAEKLLASSSVSALVTESVFSMDGDCAPIEALSELCKVHQSYLIVDDAHGFGVLLRTEKLEVDVQIITFGKAMGCQGAAVLGRRNLIDYLVSHSRDYIYSTALSPLNAAIALNACRYIYSTPKLTQALDDNIAYFRSQAKNQGIELLKSDTPIQAVMIGDPQQALIASDELKQAGIWITAIRTPTVPKDTDRLRVTITAKHTKQELDTCVDELSRVLQSSDISPNFYIEKKRG